MSRETLHLSQQQIRQDRQLALADRSTQQVPRGGIHRVEESFRLYINPAAIGVIVGPGYWIRNNIPLTSAAAAPTWAGGGSAPSSGYFEVWAELDDVTTPTTLVCNYRAQGGIWTAPVADNRWRMLGEYSVAAGLVIIQAQYHVRIIQDWA